MKIALGLTIVAQVLTTTISGSLTLWLVFVVSYRSVRVVVSCLVLSLLFLSLSCLAFCVVRERDGESLRLRLKLRLRDQTRQNPKRERKR
jgi:hypothetical protein